MGRDSRARRAWTAGWAVAALTVVPLVADSPATSATSAVSTLPRTTLTATARDLGTLGGRTSTAEDVDGTVVVGRASTTAGPEHAFAYDLASSTMRDLGTLGGPSSEAVAVAGNLVVGNADTADAKRRAFVYDLTTSSMRDLGSLGSGSSVAADVDGSVVVGTSDNRAFAYDLASPAPVMQDLGTLGRQRSTATAVDGSTVVGSFSSDEIDFHHAFAYDLTTSTMRDLGDLGWAFSNAYDVDGSLVVGQSYTFGFHFGDEGRSAFTYDLAAPSAAMRGIGNLGFDTSVATAVEGPVVAGSSWTTSASQSHAFALDVRAVSRRPRDLGWLGGLGLSVLDLRDGVVVGQAARAGDDRPRAFAVDVASFGASVTDLGTVGGHEAGATATTGRTVVGWSTTAGGARHATAWTLVTTTAPSLRFGRVRYVVQENAHVARVTVVRDGNPDRAVTVRYAARDVGRVAGHDFVPVHGTFRFGPGQVRKTFNVRIRDDARREVQEDFLLTLRSPSAGAILGTPSTAGLVVRASDQRPDGWVSTSPSSSYVGNNVYNSTGTRQTRTVTGRPGQTRVFHVRVYNDGNAVNTFVLRGSRARSGSTVRYLAEGRDVTGSMLANAGRRIRMGPGLSTSLTVRVTPGRTAATGSLKPATVTATWRGDGTRTDVVRGQVKVVR